MGNKCEYPYGSHMGQIWGNPNGKHMKMPIWVYYGVNLGVPKWETNVNAHMGILWEHPGQTQIGNKCEHPYGSHMGQTWGNPNGKYMKMPIWVKYGDNLGNPGEKHV